MRYKETTAPQRPIVCDCQDSAEVGFRRLGKQFVEPSDRDKILLGKILYFVWGVELSAE
jgi:hypothetical protein